jgi:hypothetical protein
MYVLGRLIQSKKSNKSFCKKYAEQTTLFVPIGLHALWDTKTICCQVCWTIIPNKDRCTYWKRPTLFVIGLCYNLQLKIFFCNFPAYKKLSFFLLIQYTFQTYKRGSFFQIFNRSVGPELFLNISSDEGEETFFWINALLSDDKQTRMSQ